MPTGKKPAPGPLTLELTAMLREHIARENKWSYAEIAAASGIKPSTFSALLGGGKQIDIEQLDRITWSLGLDLVEVLRTAESRTTNRQTSKDWPADRLKSSTPAR